ncbi:MAG: transglycosylase SLT domain-containing protein [Pseudomonadota bacterium]
MKRLSILIFSVLTALVSLSSAQGQEAPADAAPPIENPVLPLDLTLKAPPPLDATPKVSALPLDTTLKTPSSPLHPTLKTPYENEVTNAPDSTLPALSPPITAPADTVITTLSSDITPVLTTDHTMLQRDLWQRIREGYAMPALDSALIARHEQWYASRPEYVARMVERSQRYLHFIVDEVEKRGMPTEIALLPMIESAFNPSAYSIGHASGIWQFIPSTGKNFGLQQNWWYDGRRDIISATKGALDYLQKLHEQFGDWELALAAYNSGEGAVLRAQESNHRKGLPTDYASLKLSSETRNYVPKLLAIKNIISNPKKFGLTLQPLLNGPYFAAVTTSRHIDVKLAAELAEISVDEFNALNPAHNRPVILQENATTLLLPVNKAEIFRINLENYSKSLVSWQAYQSKKGERLDKLAPRFGMTLDKLRSINGLSQRTRLSSGQALLVPLNGNANIQFAAFNTHYIAGERPAGRTITHTVRKGETLSMVSRRYRVHLAQLQDWNNGVTNIRPGQRLTIVQAGKPARARLAASATKSPIKRVSATKSTAKNRKHWNRRAVQRISSTAKPRKRSGSRL